MQRGNKSVSNIYYISLFYYIIHITKPSGTSGSICNKSAEKLTDWLSVENLISKHYPQNIISNIESYRLCNLAGLYV